MDGLTILHLGVLLACVHAGVLLVIGYSYLVHSPVPFLTFLSFCLPVQLRSARLPWKVSPSFGAHPGWESCSPGDMVQAGRPALCASSETAGHEAHHSKDVGKCLCARTISVLECLVTNWTH